MNNHLKYLSLLLILFTLGCTNKSDLVGKRLYILGGDATNTKSIRHLTEVELYFKDDKKVYLTTAVRYGKKIKDVDTAAKEYDYTYVDKVLNIPEYGFENQKLYESNKLYNNEAEIFLYKSSFLSLSVEEKRDRLKEIYGKGWKILLTLLKKEEILKNPVYAALETNKDMEQTTSGAVEINLNTFEKIRKEADNVETNSRNRQVFLKLNSNDKPIKIINLDWPEDDTDFETIYNIVYSSKGQLLSVTQSPHSRSGDWSMSITHYFDEDGKTIGVVRNWSEFYRDIDDSIYKSGKVYYYTQIKYFDNNFKLTKRDESIMDENDRLIKDPSYDFKNFMTEFKDYPNSLALMKHLKLKP